MNTNITLPPVGTVDFVKKPVYQSLSPRVFVRIDGFPYIPLSYELTTNAHGATDTATVKLPVAGYPDWTMTLLRDDSLGNADVPVTLEVWVDPQATGSYVQRFVGIVDSYDADFASDITTFNCRSKAAPLTSNKITTPFGTASGVTDQSTTVAFVSQQAARFGLIPKITLAPGQQPGTLLQVLGSEFVTGVRNWVIWDLILQCALYDDVDAWVDRSGVLHYEAASFVTRTPLQYVWGENIKALTGTHSPQFSKNVRVVVRSYVSRTVTATTTRVTNNPGGGTITQTSSRQATGSPVFGTTEVVTTTRDSNGNKSVTTRSVSGGPSNPGATSFASESGLERYPIYVPNASPQECEEIAQRKWRDISMHEYTIKLTVPVTLAALPVMDVTALIQLFGTPYAAFNMSAGPAYGQYWPRQIREVFDVEQGWVWDIDAVNHTLPNGAV